MVSSQVTKTRVCFIFVCVYVCVCSYRQQCDLHKNRQQQNLHKTSKRFRHLRSARCHGSSSPRRGEDAQTCKSAAACIQFKNWTFLMFQNRKKRKFHRERRKRVEAAWKQNNAKTQTARKSRHQTAFIFLPLPQMKRFICWQKSLDSWDLESCSKANLKILNKHCLFEFSLQNILNMLKRV